ncbi:protein-L-isoaspartate O-methyltransferase family protein [Enterovirga aerilata]|uniref:protein-L-isoaspartate O-methyltransferase family protein n=1 Tax=Enterovirga aerilata TaxID=2730920 RepID=UPI003211EF5C
MSAALSLDPPSEFELLRQGTAAFVLSLRERGVFDLNVLRAMETVPRDFFAPRRFADLARSDVALPIPCGQTMTAPAVVAAMLAALEVKPGQRILEVGTGTGYVTALLARIGAEVHTIERQPILAESAERRLQLAGFSRIKHVCGDGLEGGDTQGRYHRILLNGVLPYLSPALTSRLVAGGRLVGGAIQNGVPQLLTIFRDEEGDLSHAFGAPVRLSPLVACRHDP